MFNKLYRSKAYPIVFQIITLLVFILLIIGGIGITTTDATFAKQLRNTNLSNLIVWSYWWPLIVLTAVLFGRHWCSICPIELLTYVFSKIGIKNKVPAFIKSGWIITILYAFVAVVAIHTWGIHRVPQLMAFYLLSLLGMALIVSIIYEKRAFCSYFCPVGKLLGLYSLLSPLGLRVKQVDVCKSCKTKDCISKSNQSKWVGRSCTSGLYPEKVEDNRDCILCTQCVKACPNNNIKLKGRLKSYALFDFNKLGTAEIGMLTILIGFVCYEIMTSWNLSETTLLALPKAFYGIGLKGVVSYKLFEGIVIFMLLPISIILGISALGKITGKNTWKFYIKRTAGFLLPVVAFGHLFKALLKTTSRIPYWQYALDKPNGEYYANSIVNKEITIQQFAGLNSVVAILGSLVLVAALFFSFQKIRKDKALTIPNRAIYFVFVLAYFSMLLLGPVSGFFGE